MNTKDLIGMNEENALNLLKKNNVMYRIVSRNGQIYMLTMDMQPSRWNLTIDNNIVTSIRNG